MVAKSQERTGKGSPPTRRREEPAFRRAQILAAAKTRFRKAGVHATKVEEIAAEAGVSVGLIYKIFSGKDGIISAIVLEDALLQFNVIYGEIERSPEDVTKALRRALAELIRFGKQKDRVALMLEILVELIRNPKLRADLLQLEATKKAEIAKRFTASGTVDDLDAMQRRIGVVAAFATGVTIQLGVGGREASEMFGEDIIDVMIGAAGFDKSRGHAEG